MIHSVKDVQDALQLLTGTRNPSVMDLDESQRSLFVEFLHPVLKWCDKPLVTAFVTSLSGIVSDESFDDALRPGEDQPDKLAKLNHGVYPSYCWPGGLLLLYEAQSEDPVTKQPVSMWVCSYCAQDIRNSEDENPVKYSVTSWKVRTSGHVYECPLCNYYRDGQLDSTL